jgi:hypothetical protein
MTQMEHANVRGNVVTSALVAAAVSATITISGLAIASSFELGAQPQAAPAAEDGAFQRLVAAERAWEAQRRVQSAAAISHERYLEQIGAEWQERFDQTNPNR